ncbi:hypothetical protein VNO77_19827 [Canavalia gladiata]|uniref:Endonuclease/exonuclease/phosphatase domain-containing protein n=1 Tax=Canavalia gladiata TaxID=3824 RepID=A0AAN9LN80_CANGL
MGAIVEEIQRKQPKYWCITGDFNIMQSQTECKRVGDGRRKRDLKDFNNFVEAARLVDLAMADRKYTWYRTKGGSMSQLDQFLLSEEWIVTKHRMRDWVRQHGGNLEEQIQQAKVQLYDIELKGEKEMLSLEENTGRTETMADIVELSIRKENLRWK